MNKDYVYKLLRYFAILGNIVFILWIIYNGIDEGSKGSTIVQDLSYISLVFLLSLDIVILYRKQ